MTVLVQGWVVRPRFTYILVAPAVLAVLCLVALGVNLWNGEEQLPPGIWAATPWFGAGGVGFALVTAVLAWRNAIRVRLVSNEAGERFLEVYDPANALIIPSPMTCKYGYLRHRVDGAGQQTTLLAGVLHEGACRVAFKEVWGTAYSPPEDWPAEVPQLNAPVVYDTLAGSFVADLVAVIGEHSPSAASKPG